MQKARILIIAEAGVNHNGDMVMAKALIDAAVLAKADAVKFQSFSAERLVAPSTAMARYQIQNTGKQETQFEMLKKLMLSRTDHDTLKKYCDEKNIIFLSTPFDEINLTMLVTEFNVPYIKISSGDLTNAPLLLAAAQCKRPVILSTGMSTLSEVESALTVLSFGFSAECNETPSIERFTKAYAKPENQLLLKKYVTLLHCTTEYPAAPTTINLQAMNTLSAAFKLRVGYSDHSDGIHIAVAAAALGATVIEKHFTLDKNLPGPDHKASLLPDELTAMIVHIRDIENALGNGVKIPSQHELINAAVARKQIITSQPIKKGERFSTENIGIKRISGNGLNPLYYWETLHSVATHDYQENELITQ